MNTPRTRTRKRRGLQTPAVREQARLARERVAAKLAAFSSRAAPGGRAMKKNSPEVIVRTTGSLCRDPEWQRLGNLASAMECAHHALCTLAGLLADQDFGATTFAEVMAEADLIYRRCRQLRARIQALEDAALAAAKAAAG